MPLATDRQRQQPHQEIRGIFLAEHSRAHHRLLLVAIEVEGRILCPAGRAKRHQQRLDLLGVGTIEDVLEDRSGKAFQRLAEKIGGSRIGFDHPSCAGIDHQNRLGGNLQQQPVTGLGMAQARILLLDRLFGCQQPLLHFRHAAHIAANRDDTAAGPRLHHHVADGNIGARRCRMIDLAPARRHAQRHVLQHLLDFRTALDRDDIAPRFARPADEQVGRQVSPGQHPVADDSVGIDDQRHVRRRRKDQRGIGRIKIRHQAVEAWLATQ